MRQQDRAENEKQITDEKQQKQDHEIPKPTVREPKLSGQQQRETDDWKVDQLELRAGYGQCGWTDLSLQIEVTWDRSHVSDNLTHVHSIPFSESFTAILADAHYQY